ncbi:MAG: 5'-nucleotidase C-terminal domain-containing protein, partial [Deltaproteobacteria bacterium]|nr:5'-nucleotidase C-terminal domain-containing protein [Deltaproteobacteria bacterium]
ILLIWYPLLLMKRFAQTIFYIFILLIASTSVTFPQHIVIIETSDFHGSFEPRPAKEINNQLTGGIEIISAHIKLLRENNPDNLILLDGGDMMQGSIISNLSKGKAVIEFYNYLNYNAATIGNHEWDFGFDEITKDPQGTLKRRVLGANFPFVVSNIYYAETGKPFVLTNLKPYTIVEKKGLRIGIIGVTTTSTPITTHPNNIKGLYFSDPSREINKVIPELRERKVNTIIVLSHTGGKCNEKNECSGEIFDIAKNLSSDDISVIFGGHTHNPLTATINGIKIVQPGSYGKSYGRVDLFFDEKDGQLIREKTKVLSPVYFTETATINNELITLKPDREVTRILAPYLISVERIKKDIICTASDDIDITFGDSLPLGQIITEAMLTYTGINADVAIYNTGGIRAGIKKGAVTYGKVYEIIPFDNTIVSMRLSGSQLKDIFEMSASSGEIDDLLGMSGLTVYVDYTKETGKRITRITKNGKDIKSNDTFVVLTNDFLYAGGDGFDTFKNGQNAVVSQTLIRDLFESFLRKKKIISLPKKSNYIITK